MSVVTYLFQKIPIRVINFRTGLISITLSFLLFYFLLIFLSLLHVNLVKVNPPAVINTYQDILARAQKDPEFQIAWSKDFPDTELFKQGGHGSNEEKNMESREFWREEAVLREARAGNDRR